MDSIIFGINILKENPTLFYIFIAYLGLCVGSFLNVVIYRLPIILNNEWRTECYQYLEQEDPTPPTPMSLSLPASRCPKCSFKLRWYHNIPVVSWLALKGKCASCKNPISFRYPCIELLTALLSVAIAWKFGVEIEVVFALIFVWISIALFFIDLDHMILPDRLVFPLIGLGLLINTQSVFVSPSQSIYGAVFGFLSLWFIYIIMKLLTGKKGMGYGDFKYLCAIGAWFGPLILHYIFVISSVLGILAFIFIAIKLKKSGQEFDSKPIAFGPYLILAAFFVLFIQ